MDPSSKILWAKVVQSICFTWIWIWVRVYRGKNSNERSKMLWLGEVTSWWSNGCVKDKGTKVRAFRKHARLEREPSFRKHARLEMSCRNGGHPSTETSRLNSRRKRIIDLKSLLSSRQHLTETITREKNSFEKIWSFKLERLFQTCFEFLSFNVHHF